MMKNVNDPAKLTLPSDREIVIERTFRAPRAAVFELWKEPAAVRAWYPCSTLQFIVCEIDFRVGGRWRWVTRDGSGREYPLSGSYREITRPERISFTQCFEPFPAGEHVVTLTFEERDGVTHLTQHILHTSRENRDAQLQSGFTRGLDELFARCDELLSTSTAA